MDVLVAEDEKISRSLLISMLERWGYSPVVAENGLQAWEILQKDDAPRLVLLDWNMPEMDGLEVTEHVRGLSDSKLPYIILLTANAERADVVKGISAGANDYILKPYDRDELHKRVDLAREKVELQQSLAQATAIG